MRSPWFLPNNAGRKNIHRSWPIADLAPGEDSLVRQLRELQHAKEEAAAAVAQGVAAAVVGWRATHEAQRYINNNEFSVSTAGAYAVIAIYGEAISEWNH